MPAPSCADLPGGCCAASSPRHRSLPSKLQKRPTGTKAVPLGLAEDRTAFGRFQDSANRKKGINRQFITCYEIGRRLERARRRRLGNPFQIIIRQSLMRIFFEQPKGLGSKNLAVEPRASSSDGERVPRPNFRPLDHSKLEFYDSR